MQEYFRFDGLNTPFQLFSLPHILALSIISFAVVLVYVFRNRLRQQKPNLLIRCSLASLMLLSEIVLQIWQIGTGGWTVDYSLPLQLCSISLLLSSVLLLTRNYTLFEFTYFAGLAGALQALITPDLGNYSFPHFRTFQFFVAHGSIIVAVFFMVFVECYRPSFWSIWKSLLLLNLLAVMIGLVNQATGGNYMFLAHKPANASLLDILGPWPWYITALEAAAVVFFLILYLPFTIKQSNNRPIRKRGFY